MCGVETPQGFGAGASTYACRAYVLCGSREPLGFGIDERRFIVSLFIAFFY
ncbi:MAG: hypothetical protein OIN88_07540 [Candidatus Methanoperedens sp.]|nr:hypothetical protein [Candidatus Methanoperedens sp.]